MSLIIPLDSTACESCHEAIWIGWEECPHCGTAREPSTEEQAHLYRARVAVFEALARAAREVVPTGLVPVTDTQYVRYMSGSGLFGSERLEEAYEAIEELNLEDVGSTRSVETRQAARRLESSADRRRRSLMDLKVTRPSGKFSEAHPHVVGAFEGFLGMIREIALWLTAWHPRDAHAHASAIQKALDEAAAELSLVNRHCNEIGEDSVFEDTPEERMRSLTGTRTAGDVRTLSDLTAMGFGDFGKYMARGPEGYRYFSDLLRTPLKEMPDEVPPILYVLALLVNSFDDPAGIRSRASLFMDVLHEAYAEDTEAMLDADVKVQDSLGEAGAMLT